MNNYPRRLIGYKAPYELFNEELDQSTDFLKIYNSGQLAIEIPEIILIYKIRIERH